MSPKNKYDEIMGIKIYLHVISSFIKSLQWVRNETLNNCKLIDKNNLY